MAVTKPRIIQDVDLFEVNKKLLRVIGFWPLDFKNDSVFNDLLRHLDKLYALTVFVTVYICYPIFEIIDWYWSWGNLQNITENICVTGIHIGGMFKCITLIMKKNDVDNCMNNFQHLMKKVSSANNRKDHVLAAENLIIATKKKCDKLTKWFLCLVVSTGIACAIYPLIDMSTFGSRFPFRSWMPFDAIKYPICAYIYKASAIFLYAALILECDVLCVTFLIHLTTQTKILRRSLRVIGNLEPDTTTNLKYGDHRESKKLTVLPMDIKRRVLTTQISFSHLSRPLNNMMHKQNRSDKIYGNFIGCIVHHQHILKLADDIENLFSNTILIQFFVSIVGLCLSGLQITVRKFDSAFIAMLAYFFCTLTEILLFCWFANETTLESQKLADAAYNSHWRHCDKRLCVSLLIFMERAKKPITFTAGRFFLLSLNMFTQILSRSYSILALLRNFLCGQSLACRT